MGKKLIKILEKMHFRRYMIAKHDNTHKNLTTNQRFRITNEMYEILDLIEEYKKKLEINKKS